MKPLKKTWKDKKRKIHHHRQEGRNSEDKTITGTNAASSRASLSTMALVRMRRAKFLATIVGRSVIIPGPAPNLEGI